MRYERIASRSRDGNAQVAGRWCAGMRHPAPRRAARGRRARRGRSPIHGGDPRLDLDRTIAGT